MSNKRAVMSNKSVVKTNKRVDKTNTAAVMSNRAVDITSGGQRAEEKQSVGPNGIPTYLVGI